MLQLDNMQAGQFLISRPAFVGPVLGWLNGCPVEGAKIGLIIELIYLDFIPVGGVVPPNGLVAAAVGVLGFAWCGLPESAAFFFGILAGLLYCNVETTLRERRSSMISGIEAQARSGTLRLKRSLAGFLLTESAISGFYIFIFSGLLSVLFSLFLKTGFVTFFGAADFAYSLMPWLGLSGLYFRFRAQVHKGG